MIELPADLAEVLKTVQSNENGADIAFPDGDEELLARLAEAWDKWNEVAGTHVQAIAQAAQRAMASMSGPAADSFQQYLEKFAAGDGSHVATTLQAGHGLAQSLHGATRALTGTKNEMIRELQYAKEYIEQNPAGKNDDIAQSEGIKQAAATYHQYIGEVGNGVDGMLRTSAGHIADMTGMGKTCTLNGAGGSGGGAGGDGTLSARTAVDGRPALAIDPRTGLPIPAGTAIDPTTGLPIPPGTAIDPTTGLPLVPGAAIDPATGLPMNAVAGTAPFAMPAPNPIGFDGAGGDGGGGGGGGSYGGGAGGGGGAYGGGDGAHGGGGGSDTPRLKPFTPLTPTQLDLGGGAGVGAGTPTFTPLPLSPSHGSLNLAGMSDLNLGGGAGGSALGTGLGVGGGLGGALGGGAGGSGAGGLSPFGGAGGLGSALGGALGGAGAFGGGADGVASARAGGLGAASAGGMGGGMGGAAAAGAMGRAGAAGGAGAGAAGSGARAGAAGGMGGGMGHMPGAGAGGRGGGGGGRKGNRFLSPTRFGTEGGEEEELPTTDAGILGQAGDAVQRDRRWQRARQGWLDDARADGTFAAPAPAPAAAPGPTSEQAVLNQLAGVLLGAPAGGDGTEPATAAETATVPGTAATATAPVEPAARQERAVTAVEPAGEEDEGYLERSRAAAARRGHPDAPETAATPAVSVAATPGTPTAAAPGTPAAEAPARPAPLREEGGYQVPSPFLRAALTRLAAPAAD
ncbi:hypothetical protein [Kitasatospora terrestris]|uniref:Outer membrane channel protein CpnT-like N-terminal domain-containing protein n=1 Tax=Kitasatospora terrestris TaxID=258051 RepID=A0ABP9DB46_9ACTN